MGTETIRYHSVSAGFSRMRSSAVVCVCASVCVLRRERGSSALYPPHHSLLPYPSPILTTGVFLHSLTSFAILHFSFSLSPTSLGHLFYLTLFDHYTTVRTRIVRVHFRMDLVKAVQEYLDKILAETKGMKVLLLDTETVRGRWREDWGKEAHEERVSLSVGIMLLLTSIRPSA